MNNKINRVLQVAGIGIIGIVLLVLAVAIFFHFIDRVVYVKNDTPDGVEVTMLLQNHDDSGFYLSQTLQIESGEEIKENIGFESVRCLYVSTQGNEYSSVFDADRYDVNDDAPPRIDIDVSSLVSSGLACPWSQTEFQEGVRNRVQLSRNKSSEWQSVDAHSFTLSLPPNWKFNRLQGIDSYIGEFVGDDMTLRFDYGAYSNPLADESDPDYVVTYEMIDGYRAKIVTPKVVESGVTGVFFEGVRGSEVIGGGNTASFELSGENFTAVQQEVALRIFRTLQFTK